VLGRPNANYEVFSVLGTQYDEIVLVVQEWVPEELLIPDEDALGSQEIGALAMRKIHDERVRIVTWLITKEMDLMCYAALEVVSRYSGSTWISHLPTGLKHRVDHANHPDQHHQALLLVV